MVLPPLLSSVATLSFGVLVTAALVCAFTYLTTLFRFHLDARKRPESHGKVQVATVPPLIPYAIPGLGSTISFSDQTIGRFWAWLRTQADRYDQDAFSIVLAGVRTNFIFSEPGVSAAFNSRQLSRARLDRQLGINVLGMSKEDATKAFPYDVDEKEKSTTARIHSDHLLGSGAVNALTSNYMQLFLAQLDSDGGLKGGIEVDLYAWLWQHIFRSSTTALCGSKLLEMFPDFDKPYKMWEDNMLGMLFGTPRLFSREAYNARDSAVDKLRQVLQVAYEHPITDGSDPDWEPYTGARVIRKRHEFYKQQGLSLHAQAGFDLIFLAGIISNATPATGWLLLHILSPTSGSDFKTRIMKELASCCLDDGKIDIPALTRLPLLNSAFHEVLRVYVDLLVVRQVDSSVVIGGHYVRQGEQVMAPTWMTHRNPAFFDSPDVFDPERFLKRDSDTGEIKYSATGLGGRYFPFGGGHYMCPGRTFAKQEVLGTIATLLLNFDIECLGFVKSPGDKLDGNVGFPGIKKGFAGNQVVGIAGDMRVKITRKT